MRKILCLLMMCILTLCGCVMVGCSDKGNDNRLIINNDNVLGTQKNFATYYQEFLNMFNDEYKLSLQTADKVTWSTNWVAKHLYQYSIAENNDGGCKTYDVFVRNNNDTPELYITINHNGYLPYAKISNGYISFSKSTNNETYYDDANKITFSENVAIQYGLLTSNMIDNFYDKINTITKFIYFNGFVINTTTGEWFKDNVYTQFYENEILFFESWLRFLE